MCYLFYIIVIVLLIVVILYLVNNQTIDKSVKSNAVNATNTQTVSQIPKVFIQTAKYDLSKKYINNLNKYIQGLKYEFYKDEDILQFFKDYPLEEFPNVSNLFKSMKYGEHKADLFRYYYLYIKGGTYMDSDMLLFKHVNDINQAYDFVTLITGSQISQSYLSAVPKHPLIYLALKDVYNIDLKNLNKNYFLLVNNLSKIYKTSNYDNTYLYPMKFKMIRGIGKQSYHYVENNNEIIMKHFSQSQSSKVPEREIIN